MEDFQKSDKFDKSDDKGKRIGRLDQQTLGYYRRVSETLVDDFPTVEEKGFILTCTLSYPIIAQHHVAAIRYSPLLR